VTLGQSIENDRFVGETAVTAGATVLWHPWDAFSPASENVESLGV